MMGRIIKLLNGNYFYHSIFNFVFIFALLLLSNCTENQSYDKNTVLEFEVNKEIVIDVPDSVNYNFEFWHISEIDSNIYMTGLINKRLEIFDLTKNRYLKRVNLYLDGPNGVGQIAQHYFHNMDSIFLFSKSDYAIYLIKSSGKVINKYDVNKSLKNINQALSIECFRNFGDRIIYKAKQKNLLLRTYPPYDLVKDTRMYNSPYKILYNIADDKVKSFFGVYPTEFTATNKYYSNDFQVSYCDQCPKKLLSFRRYHDLLEINNNDNEVLNRYNAKSNYIEKTFELIPRDAEFQTVRAHYSKNASYVNIIYDKKKKLYYRLVSHKLNKNNKKSSSIIVLNQKLQVLGEMLLPAGRYFIKSAQIHPKGILLYKYNNKENQLTYDLINPKL